MALYHYQAELGLVPQEVWFVGYILAHRWTAALPYPSVRRMSRRTGVSTQMLHRYKQSLIEKGYLVTIARHRPSGGRTSNYYDFSGLFHALEGLLLRDRRPHSWQPTADDTDDTDHPAGDGGVDGDDGDDGDHDHGEERPEAAPDETAAAITAVPHSQRQPALTWGGGRGGAGPAGQRALTGPDQAASSVGGHPHATGRGRTVASTPVSTAGPQEARGISNKPGKERSQASNNASRIALGKQSPAGTTERALHNTAERGHEPAAALAVSLSTPSATELQQRWHAALASLAQSTSTAAFRAWLEPLQPVVALDPSSHGVRDGLGAPTVDHALAGTRKAPLRLGCPTVYHRDQVERRFRPALEAALGAPVEFVIGTGRP